MSKGTIVYWLFGGALSAVYSGGEIFGWEPSSSAYERIEPSVRHAMTGGSSGGSSFWYSGSHGGK